MHVLPVQPSDAVKWLRMALWPHSSPHKEAGEIAHFFAVPPLPPLPTLHAAFVCERPAGGLCGMAESSLRSYADGCASASARTSKAGSSTPTSVTRVWGTRWWQRWRIDRAQGCRELASDASLDNTLSQQAHQRLGLRETGRVVQFCTVLGPHS